LHDRSQVLAVDRAFARALGFEPEQLVGRSPLAWLAPESRALVEFHWHDDHSGEPLLVEFLGKDGSRLACQTIGRGFERGGRRLRMVTVTPMPSGPHLFKLARRAAAHADLLLQAAGEGIIGLDIEGRIVSANPAVLQTTGYTATQLIGQTLRESLLRCDEDGGDLSDRRGPLDLAIEHGEQLTSDQFSLCRADGRCFPATVTLTPIVADDGRLDGSVLVVRDLSEQRLLTAELLQAQKLESVGMLAGGIAHDFNNLLTVISGYTALLQARLGYDEQAATPLQAIADAAASAAELTGRLLAFSCRQHSRTGPLDLNGVVQSLLGMLGRLLGERVEQQASFDPQSVRVFADPVQIEQVLMNLAVNGRDAMPDGGLLRIETKMVQLDRPLSERAGPGRYALLTVSDTGEGMDEHRCARIFDPFFTTKPVGKGTGLGLAVVQGIVSQAHGAITVSSRPGKGASFCIYLPEWSATDEAAQPVAAPAAMPRGGGETVLVCEDEPAVRGVLAELLAEAGYQPLVADSPKGALALHAQEPHVDALITDLVMPEMNGSDLARQLRQTQPDLKVLFCSGWNANLLDGELDEHARMLEKPFSQAELTGELRGLLDAA
jgi:PAS domain S-box-containing protein